MLHMGWILELLLLLHLTLAAVGTVGTNEEVSHNDREAQCRVEWSNHALPPDRKKKFSKAGSLNAPQRHIKERIVL